MEFDIVVCRCYHYDVIRLSMEFDIVEQRHHRDASMEFDIVELWKRRGHRWKQCSTVDGVRHC